MFRLGMGKNVCKKAETGRKVLTSVNWEDDCIRAAGNLKEGRIRDLHTSFAAMLFGSSRIRRYAGNAIADFMRPLSFQGLMRLEERFRECALGEWMWDAGWKDFDLLSVEPDVTSRQDVTLLLILGSFHPNGFFRERCVRELEGYSGALPFLVLRMNDWVRPVQSAAYRAARFRVMNGPVMEIIASLPALEKVKASQRRGEEELDRLAEMMRDRMQENLHQVSAEELAEQEFSVRKAYYRMLFDKKGIDFNRADELLRKEKHDCCKNILILGILRQGLCPAEKLEEYLTHKSFVIRRRVLEHLYSLRRNVWPGLEGMLLDGNRGIRELVVFILHRHTEIDVVQYYKDRAAGKSLDIALLGIGENGTREDASFVLPYLEHSDKKAVRAALLAAGRLLRCEGSGLYWKYLSGTEPMLARAAFQAAAGCDLRYGAETLYREYQRRSGKTNAGPPFFERNGRCVPGEIPQESGKGKEKTEANRKRYLVKLLIREESWERLPFLIRIYQDSNLDQGLGDMILKAMGRRNFYGRIGEEQGGEIRQLLEETESLPELLRKQILFELPYVISKP